MADTVLPLRTEKVYKVKSAVSLVNTFAGITIPQHPGLALNNWSGAHQDCYCSESVGLTGPTSDSLRVIVKSNPYGFTSVMGCNAQNQLIGMALSNGVFRIIVFDTDCNILTANVTGTALASLFSTSFAGGYFFVDQNDNAIAVGDNKLQALPTQNVVRKQQVYALTPLWTSADIVQAVTGGNNNTLYSSLPVWGQNDLYWCLLAGKFDVQQQTDGTAVSITENAYIAVVRVTPSTRKTKARSDTSTTATTTVMAKKELNTPFRQYNNNTITATEDGILFVTNGLDASGKCTSGFCYLVSYTSGTITVQWQSDYSNSGLLKAGQTNVGSGTTPTVMANPSDSTKKLVVITDNAYPQMNVVVYDYSTGAKVSETPVFSKMRSGNEASVIGVKGAVFVPSNFGHKIAPFRSQYVANEPGLAKLELDVPNNSAEIIWEQQHYTFFAMNMLARESGIIFAHSADWYDEASATEGPVFYILAIDSFDGRVIWRIPIGRGSPYCHEYGGIYFDRVGDKIFMGTREFLVSIQDFAGEK